MALKKKWSAELTIKFLEGYESYPCLWDVHSTSYKSRDERENAYQKLSELMDIEGFGRAEVKAKVRSVRNAYALELTKIKKSQHSGAGTDEVYKPKVTWFPIADRILHQVVQIRETQATEIEIESQSELGDSIEHTQSTIGEVLSPSSDDLPVVRRTIIPQKITSISTAPKRVIRKRKGSTEKAIEGLQDIAKKLEEKPNREEDNEFDCFGKSVACQLKKLPESLALESMAYIQSYIVRQRLTSNSQQISQNSFPPSSASSSGYEYISTPNSNISYCENNTNLHSNPEPERDLLSQAINASLYDEM